MYSFNLVFIADHIGYGKIIMWLKHETYYHLSKGILPKIAITVQVYKIKLFLKKLSLYFIIVININIIICNS